MNTGILIAFAAGLGLGLLGLIVAFTRQAWSAREFTRSEARVPCPHCAAMIMVMPAVKVCTDCGGEVLQVPLVALPPGTAQGWFKDPSDRHPERWWDGNAWTQWVRERPGGTRTEDPPLPRLVCGPIP